MPRKLLSHPYEKGATETWAWKTNVLESVTGDEQRIAIREYPDETLALTIGFGDDGQQIFDGEPEISGQEAIVRSLDDLIACRGEIEVPLWHLADSIVSAEWTSGTQFAGITLSSETPFYVSLGEDVLVEIGATWRRATVTAYATTSATLDFGEDTGAAAADLTQVVPLRTGLIPDLSSLQFARAAHAAQASFNVLLDRRQGRTGLADGMNAVALSTDTPNGWPLLEPRGIASGLELRIDQGLETIAGPSGFPYYVTNWTEAKLKASTADTFRRYQGNRFRYWRTLLATLRGSQGAFWFPTRRGEYHVLSADEDLETITVEGRAFVDLWSETNLKAVCLDSLDGDLAVRQVTACELSGDNSVLGILGGWGFSDPVLQLSLALPCRIDGDSVTWTYSNSASIDLNLVSVPYEFPALEDPIDWGGLLAQIDASSAFVEFDGEARYETVPIVGELGGEVTRVYANAGPEQAPANYLRAMSFEDVPFDPTLGGTVAVHLWTDTLLAQFRADQWGPGGRPDMVYEGEGELPRIFIMPGGDPEIPEKPLGKARYVKSWGDIDDAEGPSKATAPLRKEAGYELHFADVGYFSPFWNPVSVGFDDRSGNDNHLRSTGTPVSPAYRPALDERYGIEATSGAEMSVELATPLAAGAKLVAMVGKVLDLPDSGTRTLVRLEHSSGADSEVRLNSSGGIILYRGSASSAVGTLADGDWFALVAIFNGASSSIHLLKNDDTAWTVSTVDDGGGAHATVTDISWESVEYLRHALIVSDAPSSVADYREGFARQYLFQSLESQTGMQATTSDADGWAVLHDGSADYVLSVVWDPQEPGPATITLFELLNDAENGGMRWEWEKATEELTVTFIGAAGTFAETFDFTGLLDSPRPITELVFDESGPSADLYLNGDWRGSFSPSGFTFSGVQQNPLRFGEDRGWLFCELQLREGSALQYESLAWKWQRAGALLVDEDDVFPIDEDGALVIGW
jgi:hypothetical protein